MKTMNWISRKFIIHLKAQAGSLAKEKILKEVKRRLGKELESKAEIWLESEAAYTTHRPATYGRKKLKRSTIVSGKGVSLQIDLADMGEFSQLLGGNRYVLMCLDVFSRFLWAVQLRNKSASVVVGAMDSIIQMMDQKPLRVQSDLGKEFINKDMDRLMKSYGILHYHTENRETKASLVERCIRTIKEKFARYVTHSGTSSGKNILSKVVKQYNTTVHSSTEVAPVDVDLHNQEEIFNRLYNKKAPPKISHRVRKLRSGDEVKVSLLKSRFDKGYRGNWSEEIFVIRTVLKTTPVTYHLSDQRGEEILGGWYSYELLKVRRKSSNEPANKRQKQS